MDSGINVSGGAAIGATLGVGGGVAWFLREAEGDGKSVDLNIKVFSLSVYFDDQGFNGIGVSIGPGVGVIAGTITGSGTLSIKMVANTFEKIADKVSGWFSK